MVNRESVTIAIAFLLSPLAILAVGLRFYARKVKRAGYGLDDWTILGALLFSIVISVACLVAAFRGRVGQHDFNAEGKNLLTMEEAIVMGKVTYTLEWASAAASGLTKVSVQLFYKRLFLPQKGISNVFFRYALWTMLIISILWTVIFFFMNLLGCIPISRNWVIPHSHQGCIHLKPLWNTQVVSDIITDAMILALPWLPLRKIQLPLRKKVMIAGIFLLGAFTVASGVVRAYEFHVVLASTSPDYSYVFAPADYWTNIQACVGVISACLPCLAPIVIGVNIGYEKARSFVKKSVSSSSSNSSASRRSSGKSRENNSSSHSNEKLPTVEASSESKQIIRTDTWTLQSSTRTASDDAIHSTSFTHAQT